MTEAERQTPDYSTASYYLAEAAQLFLIHRALIAHEAPYYGDFYVREGYKYLAQGIAHLGYRLVKIEPEAVTSEPGFDNRHIPTSPAQTPADGGRWNEHSTAQEA